MSKKITIVILGLVVLCVIVWIYIYYPKLVVSPGKLAFIYTKYDRTIENKIILYDPNGSRFTRFTTLKENAGSTDFVKNIRDLLSGWKSLDASNPTIHLFYTRDLSATTTQLNYAFGEPFLYSGIHDNSVVIDKIYHANSKTIPQFLFVSPGGFKIVYCDEDGGLVFYNLNVANFGQGEHPKINVASQNQLLCTNRNPQGGYWFSRDGNTIYYLNFSEFRKLNLNSGIDEILNDSPYSFWDSTEGRDKQFFNNAYDKMVEIDGQNGLVIVKTVPLKNFDYITQTQAMKWPVVAQFSNSNVSQTMMTEDGKGIFYLHENTTTTSVDFGYYDLETNKDHFPIFSYSNSKTWGHPELVGAYNKSNLIYIVESAKDDPAHDSVLYDGSVNGKSLQVDKSWRGFKLESFIVKNLLND